jgi:hypothetical protein
MATSKQIAANRANARRSTGPRTTAGKRASSRNATKHGLLAAACVLPDEDSSVFADQVEALFEDFRPVGEFEEALVRRIAGLLWRLNRAARIETGVFIAKRDEDEVRALRRTVSELDDNAASNAFWRELGLGNSRPGFKLAQRHLASGTFDERSAAARRLRKAEAESDRGISSLGAIYTNRADTIAKLGRYETALDRSLGRALHELQRLQAKREGMPVAPPVAADIDVSLTVP